MFFRSFQHHFDGTTDAHAKAGGFGDEDFHVTSGLISAMDQTARMLWQRIAARLANP
jgi:hypothetical protein